MEQAPVYNAAPEDEELKKYYDEYLQKCCEVGQYIHNIDQLDSQKREMEKNLEVSQRSAKSAAHKHKEAQQKKYEKMKVAEPKLEMKDQH